MKINKGQLMKTILCFIFTLLTFVTLPFVPNSFAQDDSPEYVVRLIYFLPNDHEARSDIDNELDTLIKNVQNFYATHLEAHGFERKTFRIETDNSENAIVHHINGKFNDSHYQKTGDTWTEIAEQFDTSKHIYLCFVESHGNCLNLQHTPDNPCIIGVGGGNSLNGRATVLYQSIEDENRSADSEYVAIHELCHAFGLMHDRRHNAKWIHTFGYTDRMITSFCAAEWLDGHRYFNDREAPFNQDTKVEMLSPVLGSPWPYIRFRFEMTDPDGLHQVQLLAPQRDSLIDYESLDGSSNRTVEFVTNDWTGESSFSLRVMDVYGNFEVFSFSIDVNDLLPSPEVIVIPDPHLEAAVRETLSIFKSKKETITQLDMLRLRSLFIGNNSEIADITGLEHALNLERLIIHKGNKIRDMTPLSDLTQLRLLSLHQTQIRDITPLASLTALETLVLNISQVNDIKALSGLTQLKTLEMFNNQVSDITPLAGLKQLKQLELGRNQVANITPLTPLTALEYLDISNNPINDVSSLEGLVNLEELRLIGNPIKNRKPLLALLRKNPDVKIYLKNIEEALPVSLSSFKAEQTTAGVLLKWTTESEVDNAGFYIYRSETKNGEFKVVNPTMIQGAGTTGERNEYTWTDTTAKPNTVYYYRIEDVSHAGDREQLATVRLRGLVSASGKLTTRWADLKAEN